MDRDLSQQQIRQLLVDQVIDEEYDAESELSDVSDSGDNDPFLIQTQDEEIFDESDESEFDDSSNNTDSNSESNGIIVETPNEACYNSKDGTQKWQKTPEVDVRGRAAQQNIIPEVPGPTRHATRSTESISDCFFLFMKQDIIEDICKWTNQKGLLKFHSNWKDVTAAEMRKYFGVLILSGVYKSKNEDMKQLWNLTDGRPVFNKIMTRNRFSELTSCLRFDNAEERHRDAENEARDKIGPIRKVFDSWNKNLLQPYVPGVDLTIDEQLITFRGRCPFRQYIPSKPGKYGIKKWVICDSLTSYVLKMDIYKGKEVHQSRQVNLGEKVVLNLVEPFKRSGRNITCDNFFTSLGLARKLLNDNLTVVGTIRKNKKELPKEFVTAKKRSVLSTMYGFQKDAMICSYCPKKGKIVLLLSSLHLEKGPEQGASRKPEIIIDYNKCKGGVDTMDQMVRTFSVKRMTRRWPMVVFYNMIDVSALNATVLWTWLNKGNSNFQKKGPTLRRFLLLKLAKEMAGIQEGTTNNLSGINISSGYHTEEGAHAKKKRCFICPSAKNRKSRSVCVKCSRNVCGEHSNLICKTCM